MLSKKSSIYIEKNKENILNEPQGISNGSTLNNKKKKQKTLVNFKLRG